MQTALRMRLEVSRSKEDEDEDEDESQGKRERERCTSTASSLYKQVTKKFNYSACHRHRELGENLIITQLCSKLSYHAPPQCLGLDDKARHRYQLLLRFVQQGFLDFGGLCDFLDPPIGPPPWQKVERVLSVVKSGGIERQQCLFWKFKAQRTNLHADQSDLDLRLLGRVTRNVD